MIGLGIIGCGSHALRSHVKPGIEAGFVATAVCDPLDENVTALTRLIGSDLNRRKTVAELVRDPAVEAVLICSPDKFHATQLLEVVEAGLPVLCDKPLASTPTELKYVRGALALAQKRRTVVHSCHPRRDHINDNMPYGWVKENLPELKRRFGPLVHVALDFSYHAPSDPDKHTSLLLDHFPHEIDYLRWLLGDQPLTAQRHSNRFDHYSVSGVMGNGNQNSVLFTCVGTRELEQTVYPETIMLRLARGTCTVYTTAGEVHLRDHGTQRTQYINISPLMGNQAYDRIFLTVMRNFAHAIQHGPHEQSLKDLEVNATSAIELVTDGTYTYLP